MIDRVTGLINMLKYFLSAAPPQALMASLRELYPNYYVDLKQLKLELLGENMTTNDNIIRFNNIKLWTEKTLTIEEIEYKNKHKALRFLFTPLLESKILEKASELKTDILGDADIDVVEESETPAHVQPRGGPKPPQPQN